MKSAAAYNRERSYGVTEADYEALLEVQDGACAICRRPESAAINGRVKDLAVDHDHRTGAIRGLLCTRCNQMLGMAQENPAVLLSAIRYLAQAWSQPGQERPELLTDDATAIFIADAEEQGIPMRAYAREHGIVYSRQAVRARGQMAERGRRCSAARVHVL